MIRLLNNYIVLLFLLFLLFFVGHNLTLADDSAWYDEYMYKDQVVYCISVSNPEIVGDNSFLVFDYQADIGSKLGKPWTIIEKGKCYEFDHEGYAIYKVNIINGNEKEIISDYKSYNINDNFRETFCEELNEEEDGYNISHGFDSCRTTTSISSIDIIVLDFYYLYGLDYTTNEMFQINNLFKTVYSPQYLIINENATKSEEDKILLADKDFIELKENYLSLANELDSIFTSCDKRIKIEVRLTLFYDDNSEVETSREIIWKFKDGKEFVINYDGLSEIEKSLKEIELMGCRDEYSTFIKNNDDNFKEVDRLAENIINKYPFTVGRNIETRDVVELNKISDFASVEAPEGLRINEINSEHTVLEEPTPEINMDMIKDSNKLFTKVYFWLPLGAIIGLFLVVFINKNHKK